LQNLLVQQVSKGCLVEKDQITITAWPPTFILTVPHLQLLQVAKRLGVVRVYTNSIFLNRVRIGTLNLSLPLLVEKVEAVPTVDHDLQ
jgi:hypothetical protein